mmetsp:Transcript_5655/g.21900  ORF Transcript_5655/g.21900 Transcript_5655/m.21900 type:complete len:237 (+) Transcript_5655:2030-2740(+)
MQRCRSDASPVLDSAAVERLALGPGEHVEHVAARPRFAGRAVVGAQAPGLGGGQARVGKGVTRQAAQEKDLAAIGRPGIDDAVHQRGQAWRVAAVLGALQDGACLGGMLVGVDALAQGAQGLPQLLLARPLRRDLEQWPCRRGQHAEHGQHHQHLDQGEAAHLHRINAALRRWSAPSHPAAPRPTRHSAPGPTAPSPRCSAPRRSRPARPAAPAPCRHAAAARTARGRASGRAGSG